MTTTKRDWTLTIYDKETGHTILTRNLCTDSEQTAIKRAREYGKTYPGKAIMLHRVIKLEDV